MADSSLSFTILLGDLPLLVVRELLRLCRTLPQLRLVGPIAGAAELAAQVRTLRPAVVLAEESQLPDLEPLPSPTRLLVYPSPRPALTALLRSSARRATAGRLALLPLARPELEQWRRQLLTQLCQALPVLIMPSPRPAQELPPSGLIVIGASTGGPRAVEELLRQLTPDLSCAVLVGVHLPASFTASFVARLRRTSSLPVSAATAGSRLQAGQVLVVPGGTDMVVRRHSSGQWSTYPATEHNPGSDVPSVDLLMSSAATAAERVLGVVLTGLGHDGTLGARAIREKGGQVLVQDADSAAVFSMPGAVLRAGWATAALPLAGLAAAINQFGRQPAARPRPIPRPSIFTAHAA